MEPKVLISFCNSSFKYKTFINVDNINNKLKNKNS